MIDTQLNIDYINQSMRELLSEIGLGFMPSTAYDTAWIARLAELAPDLGVPALQWLRDNQLSDGSWGANNPRYHHDRLICTLAAMTALAKYGNEEDFRRCQRAQLALKPVANGLLADPAGATVGFEMIAPTLLKEAHDLNLIGDWHNDVLDQLTKYRQAKIAKLPGGMINRTVTVAFSLEMAGPDGQHLLDVNNLQEWNGSIGLSPSATAFYAVHVDPGNSAAINYLRNIVAKDGGVGDIKPFDVFEQGWTLWNLALLEPLDDELLALCKPHLDFLEKNWHPGIGIGTAADYPPKDGDDTGLIYKVLTKYGRKVDQEAMFKYEESDCFRCYALEANPSISTNVHILGGLRTAGFTPEHPAVLKVLGFLMRSQTIRLFWFDKWHSSPYYPTAHLVVVAAGYVDELVDNAVYWILETQNQDGSWGYYMPTAEETAYCLQALVIWRRNGHPVPDEAIQRGAAWLQAHMDDPYPPLWIGKCLYRPHYVVRSSILSALMLVAQG